MLQFIYVLALLSIVYSKAQLGVYRSAAPSGPPEVDQYSQWLNNPVVYALEFEADQTWQHISGEYETWWLVPWSTWVNAAPNRYLVLSIPMIPQTPASANIGDGAKGAYNSYFQTLGQQLVKYKLENTVLRIGWEFNGGWYRWNAIPGCATWAQYYKNIVQTMKSVPGNKFTTVWNPNNGWLSVVAPPCWPGDQFVDYVGVDIYDEDWSVYKWPINRAFGQWSSSANYENGDGVEYQLSVWKALKNNNGVTPGKDSSTWTLIADPATLAQVREQAWNDLYSGGYGLEFWTGFAKNHSKPITLNEWGVWAQPHGGFDNPHYIQKIYEYIQANNVAFYSYFDVYAFDGDHKLSPPTEFPIASQRFHDLFAVPK